MSQKALRSPQYINATAASNTLSTTLKISIGGTLRYTLLKNTTAGSNVVFEYAELARDYFTTSFNGLYTIQELTIQLQIFGYAGANGTGNPTEDIVNITVKGVDGFGTFMEGANPAIPFPSRTAPAWLVCSKASNGYSQIFVPVGVEGKAPYMQGVGSDYQLSYEDYSTTEEEIGGEGEITQVLKINRVDCSKYGTGNKFTFVNKYGMLQDIYFFLKNVKRLNRTTENFQRNIINTTGAVTYDVNDASKKHFNTEGTQSNIFNSGYYPEEANCMFEELLLSNYVWMTRPSTSGSGVEVVPVMVKSSDLVYKTSLNDKLIEYTVEFEDAFDYINNVR
tara:strand:+ start:2830 stop:3837 length:1008 start_codon:yes stop_codon:yes gene_type:complete